MVRNCMYLCFFFFLSNRVFNLKECSSEKNKIFQFVKASKVISVWLYNTLLKMVFNIFILLFSVNLQPLCMSFRPVSYPENHYSLSPAGGDKVLPYRNPSASFSSPSSGLVNLSTMGPPGITPGPFVRYKPSPDRCVCVGGCVCVWSFVFRGSPPSLLSSWLNMSHITHDDCVFLCWSLEDKAE